MSLSLLPSVSASSLTQKKPLQGAKTPVIPNRSGNKQARFISCENKQGGEHGHDNHVIDRRNVLLGIGGLYGATATVGSQGKVAIGAPVQPPDLSKCHLATDDATKEKVNCCPPYSMANIIDFVPPSPDEPLRRRKPAHKLSPVEIEKFKTAIAKMKALDEDDPWNFMQQATIHCTYCNGAFDQVGFPKTPLQVHDSWLFLPWHRYYLYFWERILGKLIGDPTFAIPYWNWDNPEGMRMPEFYLDKSSPLYNDNRNHNHYNALMDYDYKFGDPNPTPTQAPGVIFNNLTDVYLMYNADGLAKPSSFMGGPLSAGVSKEAPGSLERLHNLAHEWTGPEASPHHDMGNFSTTARDTMFFGHHANVDRLWDVYSTLRGQKIEFNDPDWLDASFIFYDENRQVVKVKVRDCINVEYLGYSYKPEKYFWKDIRRRYKDAIKAKKRAARGQALLTPVSEFGTQPRALDAPIRVLVPRPKVSRTKDEKEDEVEVLVIDDIEIEHGLHAKFNVYIEKPIEGLVGPDYGALAGKFRRLPHLHSKNFQPTGIKSKLELGISNLLDDIDAESSDNIVVTLVPKQGEVVIGKVYIELVEADL